MKMKFTLARIIFVYTLMLVLNLVSLAQLRPFPPRSGSVFGDDILSAKEITALYRRPTREEAEILKPAAEDAEKYAAFLRQPNFGLTRFLDDVGCADNSRVVVVSAKCEGLTMPGAGSAFSFRIKDYRIPSLADLAFSKGGFQATGVLVHGILGRIGDIPLENVTLETKGLKYLIDFQPITYYDQAKQVAQQLVKGVESEGFLYRRGLNALENTTYILRSIAYNGKFMRTVNGKIYNELDFDRRKDIIVAFRIVRKDADGSVTVLWKVLSEKDAPKIKGKAAETVKNAKRSN